MDLEHFISSMPDRDPAGSDAARVFVRLVSPRTVISVDLIRCADCLSMHPARMQVMAVAPKVFPAADLGLRHEGGGFVQDPNDPNNFTVV